MDRVLCQGRADKQLTACQEVASVLQGVGMLEFFEFNNPQLLEQALTNRSFAHEHQLAFDNERFEFLGDAVLSLAVSDFLMKKWPDKNEGDLSKLRASLVNDKSLAKMADDLKLGEKIKMGRQHKQPLSSRLLASSLEAVIGAHFLDKSFEGAQELVHRLFAPYVAHEHLMLFEDHKTRLQEVLQKKHKTRPDYVCTHSIGPDHEKTFYVSVFHDKKCIGSGQGASKKQAEFRAALEALKSIEL